MTHHATALPLQWAKKDQTLSIPPLTSRAEPLRGTGVTISLPAATALGVALRYLAVHNTLRSNTLAQSSGKILAFRGLKP